MHLEWPNFVHLLNILNLAKQLNSVASIVVKEINFFKEIF